MLNHRCYFICNVFGGADTSLIETDTKHLIAFCETMYIPVSPASEQNQYYLSVVGDSEYELYLKVNALMAFAALHEMTLTLLSKTSFDQMVVKK